VRLVPVKPTPSTGRNVVKIRLALIATVAALVAAPLAATSQATACNPEIPGACLVVDVVCMHGRLCQ
jgi:hypothetical protein